MLELHIGNSKTCFEQTRTPLSKFIIDIINHICRICEKMPSWHYCSSRIYTMLQYTPSSSWMQTLRYRMRLGNSDSMWCNSFGKCPFPAPAAWIRFLQVSIHIEVTFSDTNGFSWLNICKHQISMIWYIAEVLSRELVRTYDINLSLR